MAETHTHDDEEQEKLEPKVETQEVGPCKIKVRIEVDAAKVKDRIDHKYQDLNEKMQFPGFRPGKTPRNIIERKYGKSILDDVKFELLSQSFEEAKEANKLEPLGEPEFDPEKIEVKEGAAFGYEFTIEVKPSFDLKNYKGVKVAKQAIAVEETEIDQHLDEIREHKAELVPAEDGAKEKDAIVADFELVVDGTSHDKTENGQVNLMPNISFYGRELPDFSKSVEGHKAGDVVEYPIDLPADFKHKAIAGKKGVIKTTLKTVKRRKLPEVNAEFAKSFDCDTVQELRDDVKKRLLKAKEREAKEKMGDAIVETLIKENDFKLPEGYVKTQGEALEKRARAELTMHGAAKEKVDEEVSKQLEGSKDRIESAIKEELILDQIASKEKLFVTEEEVEDRLFKMANEMGQPVAEVRAYFEEHGYLAHIRRTMRREKVRELLVEKALVE